MIARLEEWLAAAGARLERSRHARPGGYASGWRLIPAGTARGRILVAHGGGNDALYPLLALCKPLVRAGWELFAFDLDGHGRDSTSVCDPLALRGALAAARAAAERDRPALPLHLLGHSLGGSLALDALAGGGCADAASAVVLSAPLGIRVTPRVALSELASFLRPATLTQREHYGAWGLVPAVGPLRRGAFPLRIAPEARGAGTLGYVATMQAVLDQAALERRAAAITAPLLLIYGAADALVPAEQGRRLAAAIPGATLVEIPGASHWSLAWSSATVRRVLDWFAAA